MPKQADNQPTENPALAEAEVSPQASDILAISQSCLGHALAGPTGLSVNDKSLFPAAVEAVKTDLAQAIDIVKNKRARIRNQKVILQNEANAIGQGNTDFANFHRLAAQAIVNCQDAAVAAQNAKAGLDMVFSKRIEIDYRLSLLDVLDAQLAQDQDGLTSAMNTLDSMVLAIQ